jgi:hypothetical protein
MARSKTYSFTMAAADDDAVCLSQTPTGAGALTIAGAMASGGVATLDVPRNLLLTAAANDSARTLTITGTDRYGRALSVATAAPNATTATVALYDFKTVTGVRIDAASAGALKIGTGSSLEGQWIPIDWANFVEATVAVVVSAGASLSYTVQSTVDEIESASFTEPGANAFPVGVLTGTASAMALLSGPLRAIRLNLSSWVSGTATLTMLQRSSR